MSGLSWLDGKSWAEVTRDERALCAEAFFLIRVDVGRFVTYLNRAHRAGLDESANWEVAHEAVFYRDVLHLRGNDKARFSGKRTFDLALLSDACVLIIEAKAQQGFKTDQLGDFAEDCRYVREITGVADVRMASLVSSRYSPTPSTMAFFDGPHLTWKDLAELYRQKDGRPHVVFERADAIYGR